MREKTLQVEHLQTCEMDLDMRWAPDIVTLEGEGYKSTLFQTCD